MATQSSPELPATKADRRYLYLGAGLVTAIIAYVVIAQVWVYVQAATKATAIADRQQSIRSELHRARALWNTRSFSNYRLQIWFGPPDVPDCMQELEVIERGETKTLSDTCAARRYDPALLRFLGGGISVSGLFSYIDHEVSHVGECGPNGCACDGGRTIDVVYDTQYGYPKTFSERDEPGWPSKQWARTCTAVGPNFASPFTVSVRPIDRMSVH